MNETDANKGVLLGYLGSREIMLNWTRMDFIPLCTSYRAHFHFFLLFHLYPTLPWWKTTDCTSTVVEEMTADCSKGWNVSYCKSYMKHLRWLLVNEKYYVGNGPYLLWCCFFLVNMNVCILYLQTWAEINYSKMLMPSFSMHVIYVGISLRVLCLSGF